jgi:hypothetical protein
MNTGFAFLVRSPRMLPTLLAMLCLVAAAEAQHGGGGGHSGGGHFGGGHYSGGHSSAKHADGSQSSGHFRWLRFGFGRHATPVTAPSASNTSRNIPERLLSIPGGVRTPSRTPSTFLWSPRISPWTPGSQAAMVSSAARGSFLHYRYRRFPSSGCYLNKIGQVCFFEPFFPLLSFYGGFDLFYLGFGFGGDSPDLGDGVGAQGLVQSEVSTIPQTNSSDEDATEGNSAIPSPTPGLSAEDSPVGKGVFLLVLKNGSTHAVIDYWVADGYLEYISPDGTRSHIPLEALDLQSTVSENAPRGLPFVLRFGPAQNR